MDLEVLNIAIEYIESHLDKDVSVEDVCKRTHYSARQLDRIFTENLKVTVSKYIRKRRVTVALLEIAENQAQIGFTANRFQYEFAAFSRAVRSQHGRSPKELAGNLNEIDLFSKADIESIINNLRVIEETLSGLQTKGILNYKLSANKQKAVLTNLNYRWLYSFLRSRPAIPVPFIFVNNLANSNCLDKLRAIIACSYYELMQNDFDISKVTWNPAYWSSFIQEENQQLETIYSEIECFYDLDNPVVDKEDKMLWYRPKNDFIYKLLGVIGGQDMKKPPVSYAVNEMEFLEFVEAGYKANLVKVYGNVNENDIVMDINVRKLLDIINEIGSEVTLPKKNVKDLESREAIVFLLALNKEIMIALADGQPFEKDENELAMKFFIVANYFNIDRPIKTNDAYIYNFDPFILGVLNSLAEIEEKELGSVPLSYKVIQEEDNLMLRLTEPFQMLFIEEKMESEKSERKNEKR